jgi:flagellar protein FlaG
MNLDSVTFMNGAAIATPKSNLNVNGNHPAVPSSSKGTGSSPTKTNTDPAQIQETLKQMVNELNQTMKNMQRNLNFSFDAQLNVQVVTVTNTTTGEVVRQIPSETVLKVSHSIDAIKGLLQDHKI